MTNQGSSKKIVAGTAVILAAAAALLGVWLLMGGTELKDKDQTGAASNPNAAGRTSAETYNGLGGTFKNTLAEIDTPDPSVVYKDGYYYMTFTHNGTDVMVMKSRTLDFRRAERKVVWYPPVDKMYSANLWAPEIQFLQGKWYIYFAADNGVNENHRMYALEADTDDPMGTYSFKGQVTDETNKWAIDGLALEHENKLYFIWSGWEGDMNIRQNTYIAPMSDPLTISGPRVLLSQPDLEWEKAGGPPYINEGQSILKKDGNVFLVYSGAGSWTPFYSLGMLSLKAGGDPLAAADWTKSLEPLLQMDEEAGVFGPGHNSFVPSPDGTEDWIVYHATSGISDGWNNRKARAQRVIWGADGMPQFGGPLSLDTAIGVPSGAGVFEAASAAIENGRMTFEHIPSSIDSEAPLLIRYRNTSGSAKKADMLVNGQAAGEIGLAKTDSDQSGYGYTTVKLTASDNAISFPAATEGWQIEAVEISRVEAESGQGEGGPQAEGNPFASAGGIMRTNEGEEALISFPNLLVPVKGAYTVRIAADNSAGREQKITIRTSDGVKKTVTVPATDRNAFALTEAVIMLPAGVFELTLETKGALAIDYLDIMR